MIQTKHFGLKELTVLVQETGKAELCNLSQSLFYSLLKKSREIRQETLQALIIKSMTKLAGRRVKLNCVVIALDSQFFFPSSLVSLSDNKTIQFPHTKIQLLAVFRLTS